MIAIDVIHRMKEDFKQLDRTDDFVAYVSAADGVSGDNEKRRWPFLQRLASLGHDTDRGDESIRRLVKAKEGINFNSVATDSGVSKATLYNNPEIRVRIESLRQQQAQVPTPKQIKREMDENNKDAIIASLKRKMKKLEEENKKLREQLKFSYAEVYQKI